MAWRTLYFALLPLIFLPAAFSQDAATIQVTVHADGPMGAFTPIWSYFGADEPNYIYGPHGRELLHELGDLGRTADVPVYFRAHNLFTTGNGEGSLKWGSTNVYTERADGTPVYDWTITDRIFDTMRSAVRRVLPHAKIGGPDSTGVYARKNGPSKSEAFLRQFLEHCAKGRNAATSGTGAPLDFISFHPKGAPKFVNGHVVMNVGHQLAAVERGMEVVASYPEWRNTPIVLGESDPEGCAACQGPQNGYRNGPLYGVSVAEATARTWELARKHGVRVQGAVTCAFTFEDQPYFAGFRELATNGVDKAVLNVFRMMAMLGGYWVQTRAQAQCRLSRS
jgi:Glycosyl hydrolases family 39